MKIQPIKGMHDFYPENQEILEYIRDTWINLGKIFGYQKYEGPTLEPIELYLEKTSEEIVKEQTFTFLDKKNKSFVLRPEMTPTLARMVVQREYELNPPIRWQSFGRFYRYEKPQKGRTRSFYQWNIDLIGEDSITSDIEILEIAVESLRKLNLSPDDVKIRFNNRKVIEELLKNSFGIEEKKVSEVLRILDRIDKISNSKTIELLNNLNISSEIASKIINFFTNDDILENDEWLSKILSISKEIGISEYLHFDKKVIRGFDYYTGIVFEAWSNTSLKRALFGGGRYDNLTKTLGGKRYLPGIGFAIGDVAILEVLKELDKLKIKQQKKILFIPLSKSAYIICKKFCSSLQVANKIAVINNNYNKKLKNTLKFASSENFNYVAIIGDEEIENNTIKLKCLTTRSEEIISSSEIFNRLNEVLKN